MFPSLKELLSVNVAPGGTHAHFAPFSFAFGAKVQPQNRIGEDAAAIDAVVLELMEVQRLLEADDLKAGRERVAEILRGLTG